MVFPVGKRTVKAPPVLSHFLPCFVPSRLSVGLFVAVVGMESFCINKPNISGFDFGAFYLNLQNFLGLLVFSY